MAESQLGIALWRGIFSLGHKPLELTFAPAAMRILTSSKLQSSTALCSAPSPAVLLPPLFPSGVGTGVGSGVGTGVGWGVGTGVGWGVGTGVGWGVGTGVGWGVGSGVGWAVGSGVGWDIGTGVPVGLGVGIGTGVYVGLGVNVGCGVFNSTVGGWSPSMGGSVVGRVENIPAGGVGEVAKPSSELLQATIASNTSMPTATFNSICSVLRPEFLPNICSFSPVSLPVSRPPPIVSLY